MARVKCRVCSNEKDGKCTIKDVKIKLNKSRSCDLFIHDPSKIKLKTKLKSTYVPYHMINRDARRSFIKEQQVKQSITNRSPLDSPDCLSRFRSTAASGTLTEEE